LPGVNWARFPSQLKVWSAQREVSRVSKSSCQASENAPLCPVPPVAVPGVPLSPEGDGSSPLPASQDMARFPRDPAATRHRARFFARCMAKTVSRDGLPDFASCGMLGVVSRALLQPFPMRERSRAQVWTYSPPHRRPRHFHREPELNLVAEGWARFGVGSGTRLVRAGELLSFAPGQDHELIDGSSDLLLFAIGVGPALAKDLPEAGALSLAAPFQVWLAPNDQASLLDRCARATGEAGADQAVAELWQAAAWASRRAERRGPHVVTRRALSELEADPSQSRASLAARGRSDPGELSRHFHRDVGHTLVDFRARVRLLRFIEGVDRGASLTAAALDAGFGSYSQCHRAFRGTMGCAPGEFFGGVVRERMAEMFAPARAGEASTLVC
jgi:quercetin dioxygenase-like cupin family protein/AraC-like DNA-binding protein